MILRGVCQHMQDGEGQRRPYHRLVKTTPKPNATKNSRGELPGVLLFFPESVGVAVGGAEAVPVASAMFNWCLCVG